MERYIWIVRESQLKLFKRTGECNRCGECCSQFGYTFRWTGSKIKTTDSEALTEEDLAAYENWAIENWDNTGEWTWWSPVEIHDIEKPCSAWDSETRLCLIRDHEEFATRKGGMCGKFPFRPEDMEGLTDCSFRFEEVK